MSARFLADADLNLAIVHGLRQRDPAIDFRTANEAGLEGLSDFVVLELAASEGRVLVSQDKSTMPVHFVERLCAGLHSPGVLLAVPSATIGSIIESLWAIWAASDPSEWDDQIYYLPTLRQHRFR